MHVAWLVEVALQKEKRSEVMQIIISENELETAPEAVQSWVMAMFAKGGIKVEAPDGTGVPKNVSKAKKDKAVDAKPTETAKPELDIFGDPIEAKPVTHEDIRAAGMQFVKATPDGKDKFLKILAKVGAGNIKDVPVDKLAELLAMLAVA